MAEPTPSTYRTLSWLRQGMPATRAAAAAGRLSLPMRLTVNGSRNVSVDFDLAGPADVTGIDSREVIRVDPHPHTCDFEPNYFPLIEFDRPDFPWLFSPGQADANQRLQPWICLVVVRADSATMASAAGKPLPVLDCPVSELPDLADAWAWAHAEVVSESPSALTPDTLRRILRQQPERTVSRLLCPRRLDPNTRYLACLVPTYEAGRLTGLGEAVSKKQEEAMAPAWTADSAAARERRTQLPVYYHWEFGTGVGDDFEELARRLAPQSLPDTVGLRAIDVADPGWGMPKLQPGSPGATLDLGGALQTTEPHPAPWPDAERKHFQEVLRKILETGASPDTDGENPNVLAPPLYGQNLVDLAAAPAADGKPRWYAELNLDPRYRVAAGMGTLVVRYEQEHLMAAAWDQLARHEQDSQRLRQTQLAETVGAGLRDKHLGSTAEAIVSALAKSMDRKASGPPTSAAYRRLTRSRGPVAKRIERLGVAPLRSLSATVQPSAPIPEPTATELPRFAPEFRQPMYELLRDYFPDALIPGMDRVPNNAVALLETNRPFIEAFLAGLNHEMSRELLWRGFPADRAGSYFRRFWNSRGADGQPVYDIAALRDWNGESGLGENRSAPASGELVLLIRGDLLRRYPNAAVYAVKALWSNGRRELGSKEKYPLFRATMPPDVHLLGFDLNEIQARGDDNGNDAGWFFVLQEQPTEPRFGLDAATAFGGRPAHWRDLTWGHLAPDRETLQQITHIAVDGNLNDLELDGLAWGRNSAQMAAITRQRPFRVAIHARTWLQPPPEDNPHEPVNP